MSAERRVAVVTGGESGIGAGIADAFRTDGYDVAILDIGSSSTEHDDHTLRIATDVANELAVEQAFDEIGNRFGRVDALINCAGIDVRAPLDETDLGSWERVLAVNATGTFLCTRAAARVMKRAQTGSIVSISSVNAHLGWRNCTAYSAGSRK